ncbi:MAG: DUF4412 domain-containing protein [Chthoniobacterales bacterium]
MNRICSLFALGLCAIATARADLTIDQEVQGAGPVSQMFIRIKGDKTRVDASPQVSTIIDAKSGDMLNLMNEQKKYMRISGEQAKAMMQTAMQSVPKNNDKPKLTATGKKETINGFETQEYTSETPQGTSHYWIAPSYPEGAAVLKQLQSIAPQAWGISSSAAPAYADFPGVPLRTEIAIGGKEIVSTIKSIKQDALPDTLFSPPADFQEMKMPDIGRLLGGKTVKPPTGTTKPAAAPTP